MRQESKSYENSLSLQRPATSESSHLNDVVEILGKNFILLDRRSFEESQLKDFLLRQYTKALATFWLEEHPDSKIAKQVVEGNIHSDNIRDLVTEIFPETKERIVDLETALAKTDNLIHEMALGALQGPVESGSLDRQSLSVHPTGENNIIRIPRFDNHLPEYKPSGNRIEFTEEFHSQRKA